MTDKIILRERTALAQQRAQNAATPPTRICAASMPHHGYHTHYRLGDGETVQLQRPGSERAHALPSRGLAT